MDGASFAHMESVSGLEPRRRSPRSPRWRIGSTRWRLNAPSLGGGSGRDSEANEMIPRKPKLDERRRENIAHYSTDELRHYYHERPIERDNVPLRDIVVSPDELKAEIRWRAWREKWFSRFMIIGAVAAVVGAFAAIVAAIEGWN
jgi:hypothetical protein